MLRSTEDFYPCLYLEKQEDMNGRIGVGNSNTSEAHHHRDARVPSRPELVTQLRNHSHTSIANEHAAPSNPWRLSSAQSQSLRPEYLTKQKPTSSSSATSSQQHQSSQDTINLRTTSSDI